MKLQRLDVRIPLSSQSLTPCPSPGWALALLFPVCLAKPIERERCYASSNHLMELLSWDMEGEGPREHCPCSGDLQCQPLG